MMVFSFYLGYSNNNRLPADSWAEQTPHEPLETNFFCSSGSSFCLSGSSMQCRLCHRQASQWLLSEPAASCSSQRNAKDFGDIGFDWVPIMQISRRTMRTTYFHLQWLHCITASFVGGSALGMMILYGVAIVCVCVRLIKHFVPHDCRDANSHIIWSVSCDGFFFF